MQTVVVTDSSAGKHPAAGVVVLPITVALPQGEVPDHRAPPGRVLAALRRGEPVATRAPSVVDYVEAIERDGARGAVVVTPAAELTTMAGNARAAAGLADRPAAVVDSRTASSGQALVVEAAQRRAAAGGELDEVVAAAEEAAGRVRLVAAAGSLARLAERGIVPAATAERRGGGCPLFRLADGRVEVLRVVPHHADPRVALAELWHEQAGAAGEPPVVFVAGDRRRAGPLARLTGARAVERPTAAMTVHTGADVLGLAWLAAWPDR